MNDQTASDPLASIRAHNARVRDLSFSAWVVTVGVALAATTDNATLDTVCWYASCFAVGFNLSSFVTYLARMGRASRRFNAEAGDRS